MWQVPNAALWGPSCLAGWCRIPTPAGNRPQGGCRTSWPERGWRRRTKLEMHGHPGCDGAGRCAHPEHGTSRRSVRSSRRPLHATRGSSARTRDRSSASRLQPVGVVQVRPPIYPAVWCHPARLRAVGRWCGRMCACCS